MGTPSLAGFEASLSDATPASGLPPALAALWWAHRGDWHRAHQLVQSDDGADAAWVHAHLHRREGDAGNAAYWYRRAGRPVAAAPFETEWKMIAAALSGHRGRPPGAV